VDGTVFAGLHYTNVPPRGSGNLKRGSGNIASCPASVSRCSDRGGGEVMKLASVWGDLFDR
jgi:hypothetical protein